MRVRASALAALVVVGAASACDHPTTPSPLASAARALPAPTIGPTSSSAALQAPFVFFSGRNGGDDLYIVDAEGSEPRVLAHAASRSDWSRDGRIAVDSRRAGAHGILVISPTGGGERHVGQGEDPSWSPDGRFIAVTDGRDIYVLDADGGAAPRRLASPPAGFDLAMQPAWSPAGDVIAFSACTAVLTKWDFGASCRAIYTVPADGSAAPALLMEDGAHSPAWSPDGRALAFSANRNVFVSDGLGGGTRLVGSGDWPAWTSDGRLVYQTAAGGSGWRLVINDAGVERRLVPDVVSATYSDEFISVRR